MFISLCRACGTPAAAAMSYSYDDAVVRLDDLSTSPEPGTGIELCSQHADSRTAPVGWTLIDRRRASDRHLFIPLETANVA
ncbi:MAG: DUF3499 family protein [Acidimicrobiia bacterium]|nr:DUF3499 family protein [Acidimicrobiia bacterium]